MKVVSSTRANDRIRDIGRYWRRVTSQTRALAITRDLVQRTKILGHFPPAFPILYHRATPPPPREFRVLWYKGYKIVYVVVEERSEVVVVDYWHSARNPNELIDDLKSFVI